MRMSNQKMGEHGLRGLSGVGFVNLPMMPAVTRAAPVQKSPDYKFWVVNGNVDHFIPAIAVNRKPTLPLPSPFDRSGALAAWQKIGALSSETGSKDAAFAFANRAFFDGTRGAHSALSAPAVAPRPFDRVAMIRQAGMGFLNVPSVPLPRNLQELDKTKITVTADGADSIRNATPDQWASLYEYAYQRGADTARANPDTVYYLPVSKVAAVVTLRGDHYVYETVDDYAIGQYRAGKKLVFITDRAGVFTQLIGNAPTLFVPNFNKSGSSPVALGMGPMFGAAGAFAQAYRPDLTSKMLTDKAVAQTIDRFTPKSDGGFFDNVLGAAAALVSKVQDIGSAVVETSKATVQATADLAAHPTMTNLTKAVGLQTGMQFTAGAPGVEATEKIGKVIDTAAVVGTAAVFAAPLVTSNVPAGLPSMSSLTTTAKSLMTAAQTFQKLEQQKKQQEAEQQAQANAADLAARKKVLADLQAKQAASQSKGLLSNPWTLAIIAGSFLL